MSGAAAPDGVPVFVVDAFSDEAFAGNPAGVCLLDRPAPDAWMAAVAAELRHSETAFVVLGEEPLGLRWLTPRVEVALCGHATLAAVHVLMQEGLVEGSVGFSTRSGILRARRLAGAIALVLPADPARSAPRPDGLATALGVEPAWVGRSGEDLVVELDDAAKVRDLHPDLGALAGLAPRGVCVSAPGGEGCDVTVRFFGPAVGIPEDPVTGSAQCAIAHRWAERLGRDELRVHQASARGGRLRVRPMAGAVELIGAAVTVIEGRIAGPGHLVR